MLFAILQLTACCEPAHIDLLLVCDELIENLDSPPSCRNIGSEPVKDQSFTVSIDSYSIKDDKTIRFSLYDRTNDDLLIEEASGVLSDFGGAYPFTERCVSYLAHTFKLPASGVWPDILLVEVVVTDKDTIYELNREFIPI